MITRILLATSVLLSCYCVILIAIMYPWVWLAIGIGVVYLCRKEGFLRACGSARFAHIFELPDMLDGIGLPIGLIEYKTEPVAAVKGLFTSSIPADIACEQFLSPKWKRLYKPLRLNKPPHVAIFAPTGAGKGASFVVPFLLTCPDSCVVVDLKAGELARLTSDARRRMGHRVVLLDPFKAVTQTPDTLNPLDFVDKDSPFAIDDCREIAAAMVDRKEEKGDNSHFLDNAEGGIGSNCALLVQYGTGKMKSLQGVCDICSDPKNWEKAVQKMVCSDAWDGCLSRMGGNLSHLKDRELASTMSTIARFLRILSTPAIAASTGSSSFDPADLRNKKTTVYLILTPERASALCQLLRLWIGTLLRGVVKEGLQEKTKIHFVIDEANLLGKMDQISTALTIGRGFGLKLQLYYQDLGQLKKCWPDGADQTLLANCAQVYFAINDQMTAEAVSSRLGDATIIVDSGGVGTGVSHQYSQQGQGSGSYSSNRNYNWAQQARRLQKPEELMGSLSGRIAITFAGSGIPPIWTTLVRYYEASAKKNAARFWPAVNRFCQATFIFLFVAALAAALSFVTAKNLRIIETPAVVPSMWQAK